MSLHNEKLAEIIAAQKEALGISKETLDVVNFIRSDLEDKLADLKQQLEHRLHMLDVKHDTLEKNQQTIWNKLLEIAGQEPDEASKAEPKATD